MSIVIEDSFAVAAAPDATFALMSDLRRVCPCIPGAELLEEHDDGSYEVRVGMKMGPMSLAYKGSVTIDAIDQTARHATLRARAKEQRGNGTAEAEMSMVVAPDQSGGSKVALRSEMLVTGRVAQMGRGIINDVAKRMIADMAQAVEQTLLAKPPPASKSPQDGSDRPFPHGASEHPAPVISAPAPRPGRLLWQVLLSRLSRVFRWTASRRKPKS